MKITFEKFTNEYVDIFYECAEKPFIKNTWFQDGYEPKNKQAIRCYEKAGFKFVRNGVDDHGGKIYIMEKTSKAKNI